MHQHTRNGITADHNGADMSLTARFPHENPLSLAVLKAAQLHALLLMASDFVVADGSANGLQPMERESVFSLAAELAGEVLALSEMVGVAGREGGVNN